MPNSHRMLTNTSSHGKNSLTFESVVCSQLELKRRAASFSRRRSTVCRRTSAHLPLTLTANNALRKSSPMPSSSYATTPDIPLAFQKMKTDVKRTRTSSINSINTIATKSNPDRQSVVSMIYWDGASSKNAIIKKVTFEYCLRWLSSLGDSRMILEHPNGVLIFKKRNPIMEV